MATWSGELLQEEKKRTSETEDHEKQHLATLKRLKRGDENELERYLRLEKVVASKQLRLAMLTEEDRGAKLENDAATKGDGRRKKSKTGEDSCNHTAQVGRLTKEDKRAKKEWI